MLEAGKKVMVLSAGGPCAAWLVELAKAREDRSSCRPARWGSTVTGGRG
jgi:hypothetical protein